MTYSLREENSIKYLKKNYGRTKKGMEIIENWG